jgi:hypothetical protein
VNIPVPHGKTVEAEIRREGFYPEKVHLDGSRTVVVVRLTPIPGVQPRVPVPPAEPLDAFRKASEAMLLPKPTEAPTGEAPQVPAASPESPPRPPAGAPAAPASAAAEAPKQVAPIEPEPQPAAPAAVPSAPVPPTSAP